MITFSSADAMAVKMADVITAVLELSIAKRGRATMALSGGSTPAALYRVLSDTDLDWSKVTATLVDERWVAPGADGSNEQFINDTLCKGKAASITFPGMWTGEPTAAEATDRANAAYADILGGQPFDVVVMGMGPDGHSASWFPGAENLDDVLSSDRLVEASIVPETDVTGPFTERMTLTPAALLGARMTCLLMKGDEKKAVFDAASEDGPVQQLPVRALLRQTPNLWATWTR